MKLSEIKGIGAKRERLLNQLGIFTIEDMAGYFPIDYIDNTNPIRVADVKDGERCSVYVRIISAPRVFYKGKLSIVNVTAEDESGRIILRWFNQPYRASQIVEGSFVVASGRVAIKKDRAIVNPILTKKNDEIIPVYEVIKGLSQPLMRSLSQAALQNVPIYETLPAKIVNRYSLISKQQAVAELHSPTSNEALKRALERRSFEDALMYMLMVEQQKDERRKNTGIGFDIEGIRAKFLSKIPFTPTKAQIRVLHEVESDMAKSIPMNRLIQGDVGSGKTLIAEYALAVAAANGYQGAFMAPTEILARQHYENLRELFKGTCCLLLGSQSAAEKKRIHEGIRSGYYSVVIGTHAILSDTVAFHNLGLVITDEQHRFGVSQRAKLTQKGLRPDTLVMSATPIPRTLSLIVYGDLDLSIIDELPAGRKEIKTRWVKNDKRKDMYDFLEKEAMAGNQSYVVCPMIEENEDIGGTAATELYEQLKAQYHKVQVGLLHGRMTEHEKNEIMHSFKAAELGVLIATTVIEVGIDVANAVNIVIESADRFGLATLHQLRGRVGRGDKQSYCFLLTDDDRGKDNERITAMLSTNDGFEIAEMDMKIRGVGEILGTRQHGEGLGWLDALNCPAHILKNAFEAAREVLSTPTIENHELLLAAEDRFSKKEEIVMN